MDHLAKLQLEGHVSEEEQLEYTLLSEEEEGGPEPRNEAT